MRALAGILALVLALPSCCDEAGTLRVIVSLSDGRMCLTSGVSRVFIEVESQSGELVAATSLPCLELEAEGVALGELPAGLYEIHTRALSPDEGLLYAGEDLVSVLCGERATRRVVLGFVGGAG